MKILILIAILCLGTLAYGKSVKKNSKESDEENSKESTEGNSKESTEVHSIEEHQCEYNGQKYEEGKEMISTRRLCLNCTCTKDFLEPNDYNCSVIQCKNIEPLSRGCMPIYDDIECCPVDWNCTTAQPLKTKCEKRYLKHFEVKGCEPVYENGSECPVRFNCPESTPENQTVCLFKNKSYQEGESIDVGNPCKICKCRRSPSGVGVNIDCIFVECPQVFQPPLNGSCYDVYQADNCCPTKTECSADVSSHSEGNVCEYGGKTFHYGERIYPEEDHCQICLCNEQWTGVNGKSCRNHDCALDLNRKKLQEGCVPIYHEATCCPIEIYCGTPEEGYKNTTVSFSSKADIDSGKTCIFKGVHYNLGQTLNIDHPTNCVTCTCVTPPDFTCVHRSCPPPPNNDYENCESTYTPGECCLTYDCKSASAPVPVPQCSPVVCPEGCSEVTVHNSCPFCMCQKKLCAPPKCDAGCTVQTTVAEGECPGCNCPETTSSITATCSPVECPGHCFEVIDPRGCPVCMCGPVCSPPKCEPGCKIQRDVPDGECPKCNCSQTKSLKDRLQCSPVRCLAGCIEGVGESGCPSCICKPLCSPPKCEPDCYLNPFPTGPCPECVCENKESIPQLICSPVKCGPLCHEAYDGEGCGTCICDPLCSPPVCEANCQLEYDANKSPCPVCICNKECPSVTCGPMCEKQIGSDGCPTCSCKALCSAPKCKPGCHLEFDRSAGPCPSCVCPNERDIAVQCSTPKCDIGCHIDFDAKPCPACNCASDSMPEAHLSIQCSIPKCDIGCHVDYDVKPCPACDCVSELTPGVNVAVQCSTPKCDIGCGINYDAKPCPACECMFDHTSEIQCSPPKCDIGCNVNYEAKPCPSCDCESGHLQIRKSPTTRVRCAPLRCPSNCREDYSSKPCPRCACDRISRIQCSPLKCPSGCTTDYSVKPCPRCACNTDKPENPDVMCSMPKCESDCNIDYSTKPCPSCVCGTQEIPGIMCSMPKCEPGCNVDYSAKPCPSCLCGTQGIPDIMCSMPKCEPGCTIDFTTKPCPSCLCSTERIPDIMCSMPKCEDGCKLDYSTKPCPSCSCDTQGIPDIMCSMPICEPGCQLDYSSKPCPSCSCDAQAKDAIMCSPVKCDPGCTEVIANGGCPYCDCKPLCSMPKCDIGCRIDYNTQPCPSCVCDRFQRRYSPLVSNSFTVQSDPFCRSLKCGSGCEMAPQPSGAERCPMCLCNGPAGDKIKCMPMQCALPCRFERFSPHGCPSCICHPIPCPDIKCGPTTVAQKLPEDRCPKCVQIDKKNS